MKQLKYILVGLIVLLTLFGWAAVAHGQSFRTGNNVTVAKDAVVDQTLFAYGRTLDIAGTVNGDVICAGQNITVSGTVNGDVICAGQSVSITGTVSGDVRLAGQNVALNGQVAGNASVATQTFSLDSRAKVGKDLSVAGQDVTLNGPVGRDVAGSAGTLTVNSSVGRDIKAQVSTLTLGSDARVTGDIDYTSEKGLDRSKGAVVGGSVTRSAPAARHHVRPGSIIAFTVWAAVYMFAALLLIAMALVLLVPRAFHVAVEHSRQRLLKTFLMGFGASILVPVVLIGLMFTVVGIPLALFAGLVWLVITILSGPFSAYLLGRTILHTSTDNAIWTMLLGATLLLLLYFVPFLGVLTSLLALWFGLGIILMRTLHLPPPRYNMAAVSAKRR